MINKEIIQQFIDDRMNTGVFKFGCFDNVKEYKLIGYREVNTTAHDVLPGWQPGYIMIDCEYVDQGQLYVKAFQVKYTEIQQFIRDSKFIELGI